MYTLVVTIHIIVCIILVLTVLLQQGKGAEVGAVFGSSEAMFGSAGPASALNKLTTVVAIIFMITSLGLTYLAAHRTGSSVMESVKVQAPATLPAEEAPAEVPPLQHPGAEKAEPAAKDVQQPAAGSSGAEKAEPQQTSVPAKK